MLAFRPMELCTAARPISLVCHPRNSTEIKQMISVSAIVTAGDVVRLAFAMQGDFARLRIPPARAPRRAEGLWRHTCFEAFVMANSGPGYREFNFSPSGEWSMYAFRAYRDGEAMNTDSTPTIQVRTSPQRLELEAQLARVLLPPEPALRLGLSAVLEHSDGSLSYWALRHPPGQPDFHHADGFAMQLALP